MSSQRRQTYVTILSVIIFLAAIVIPAYAGTASYTYDDGNRLTGINYDDGSKIEYAYDEAGNRIVKNILTVDTTPPVTTAAPVGGIYTDTQTVTLTCNDNGGKGCDTIYYTTDGATPTTSSSVYSAALTIAATTTLKFFAKDLAGNTETVKTRVYTIGALQVTLRKDAQNIIAGVKVYLFNEAGSYLGQEKTTDAAGQAAFSAAPGTYKIRADYLGYSYWSDTIQVTTTASIDLTIPHHTVNITVSSTYQGAATPLANINAYLFTPAGTYLGLTQKTGSDGKMSFSLPARDYKVRADYLGRQYFSSVFNAQDTTITIPMAEVEITVMQGSQVLTGINVYAFTTAGSYLNISGATNASGKVTFRLPAGAYKFRANYLGNQYWSTEETLAADQSKAVTINTGGGIFTLTVFKGASDPLTGIKCYVFSEAGSYLNLSGTTDSNGQVTFNLSNGNFKFRIDYLGYQHWTDVYTVPATLAGSLAVPHQNATITVEGVYQGSQPLAGVKVYLFTPAGSYLSISKTTDSSGQVSFSLPNKSYKVRADYLGSQFWSGEFQFADATVSIQRGIAQITAKKAGIAVAGLKVYLFSEAGSYLGLNATTNAEGKAEFLLPNKSYKFRVDEGSTQHWSAVSAITGGQVNPLEVTWD
jgi:YD repeat-containing protein